MFEEKLKTIASVYVVHKYDAFAPYEFEFKDNICEKEFVNFGASTINVNANINRENRSTNLTAYWLSMAASSSPSSSFKIAWIRNQGREGGRMKDYPLGFGAPGLSTVPHLPS